MKTSLIVLIAAAGLLGMLVLSGVGLYGYANLLRSTGITYETGLNAQYLSNQNELSAYISGFYEQLGIVKYKSDKLDQILTDYAKGRNFGGGDGKAGLINAVHEAVPDLSGLNIADRILDYTQAGRTAYKLKQDKLLDMLRAYDRWKADGIVQSALVGKYFPSDHLEARIDTDVAHGNAARDKMYTIVLASQAKQAYTTGTLDPLEVK